MVGERATASNQSWERRVQGGMGETTGSGFYVCAFAERARFEREIRSAGLGEKLGIPEMREASGRSDALSSTYVDRLDVRG